MLLADDDDNDSFFFEMAFNKNADGPALVRVRDGAEVIDYLSGKGRYGDRAPQPYPELLVLDLDMPKKTGFEVLAWFQQQPHLRHIPVVVLSASKDHANIQRSLDLGANSYLTKPCQFDRYAKLVRMIKEYWLEWNESPASEPGASSRIIGFVRENDRETAGGAQAGA